MINSFLILSEDEDGSAFEFDSDEILDFILQNTEDCIVIKDKRGQYIWINQAGTSFLNLEIENVIGKTDFDLFEMETALRIRESDIEVMTSGGSGTFTAFLKPNNSDGHHFTAIKQAYRNRSGIVQGIINIVRQINPVVIR